MPAARHEVTIRRPPSEVFAFIADGTNAGRWRSGVLDVALISGSGRGAEYRQGVRGRGGRRVAADYRITEFEPGRRLAFESIAGPVRPSGLYVFERTDDGTRLTFSLQAEVPGLKGLLLGRAVQRTMEAEVGATENLKQLLEAAPNP